MSDLNQTKDELVNDLELANASHDTEKIAKLEASIKKIDEETKTHETEMKEVKKEANKEKSMQMEDLTNLLNDKPENAKKNTELIIEQSKTRLKETITKYIDKIKGLKNANTEEKDKLENEIKQLKEDLKKEKTEYEDAKKFFLGTSTYRTGELSKISTKRIRRGKKTVQGGVVTRTFTERLQFSTLRRRMTVNKLAEKFNAMGDNPTNGVRFIMGFKQARFLRYTGTKISTGLDSIGSKVGLQIDPEKFHDQFNEGKNKLFAILDKGERTPEEKKVIDAIKDRINYYGAAYARQRATAWTNPFIQAEKKADKEAKIIQIDTINQVKKEENTGKEAKVIQMNPSQEQKKEAA